MNNKTLIFKNYLKRHDIKSLVESWAPGIVLGCVLTGCGADPAGGNPNTTNPVVVPAHPFVNEEVSCTIPPGSSGVNLQRGERYSAPSLDWLMQQGWQLQPGAFEPISRARLFFDGSNRDLREQTPLMAESLYLPWQGLGRQLKITGQMRAASSELTQVELAAFINAKLEAYPDLLPLKQPLNTGLTLSQNWQEFEIEFEDFGFGPGFVRLQSTQPFEYKDLNLEALGNSLAPGNLYTDAIWFQSLNGESGEKLQAILGRGWRWTSTSTDLQSRSIEQKYLDSVVRLQWPLLNAVFARCGDSESLAKTFRLFSQPGYTGGYQVRLDIDGLVPADLRLEVIADFSLIGSSSLIYVNKIFEPKREISNGAYHVVFDINPEELPSLYFWVQSPTTPFKIKSIAVNSVSVK